eukprot:7349942-Prymnesium_polylepis.1
MMRSWRARVEDPAPAACETLIHSDRVGNVLAKGMCARGPPAMLWSPPGIQRRVSHSTCFFEVGVG